MIMDSFQLDHSVKAAYDEKQPFKCVEIYYTDSVLYQDEHEIGTDTCNGHETDSNLTVLQKSYLLT